MQQKLYNICVVGSGSGGHFYPSLMVSNELARTNKVFYVVSKNKIDHKQIKDLNFKYLVLDSLGLKNNYFSFFYYLIKNIFLIKKYLLENKINLVIGFGGSLSFCLVIAARLIGIKSIVHEQNAIIGRANKMLLNKTKLLSSYKLKDIDESLYKIVGSPLVNKKTNQALDHYDIIFVNGSLGSATMNEIIESYLKEYNDKYKILFISGNDNYCFANNNIIVKKYVDNLGSFLDSAKLVFTRGGASILAELSMTTSKVIIIPSPYVVNYHQYYNAVEFKKEYGAVIIKEEDFNKNVINEYVNKCMNSNFNLRKTVEFDNKLNNFIKEVNYELKKN